MNQHEVLIRNILINHHHENGDYWWNIRVEDNEDNEEAISQQETAIEMLTLMTTDEQEFRTLIREEYVDEKPHFQRIDWVVEMLSHMNENQKTSTETYIRIASKGLDVMKEDFYYMMNE